MDETISIDRNKSLQSRLMSKEVFAFNLQYDSKKFSRNGLLLILLSTLLGGGLGALIDLIYLYSGITNEYLVLGIGSGVGAGFGLILGLILLLALKKRMVDNFSVSYGLGIGTNIFIGGVIGTFYGAMIGSLFGLILKLLDYTLGSSLNYPVYGMLVWIALGLNIGVLVGIMASFGISGIIFGGLLSGMFVGIIGMLAIFGPDIRIMGIGGGVGVISGVIIGSLIKYSINASMGKSDRISSRLFGKKRADAAVAATGAAVVTTGAVTAMYERDRRRRQRTTSVCNSSCDTSNLDCNCGSSGGGDCGEAGAVIGLIILFGLIIILAIGLIYLLSWLSAKASARFGSAVKRGALTAISASFSIFLIIGANVGLTESFHNILFKYNVFIGMGIGLIFGLLILCALRLSVKQSHLKISPVRIVWKDRQSNGEVLLGDIEGFEFMKEQRSDDKVLACYEDYFKCTTRVGNTYKVILNCWKTPDNTNSTDYITSILQYYLDQIPRTVFPKKRTIDDIVGEEPIRPKTSSEIPFTSPGVKPLTGYSFSVRKDITDEMVAEVANLIRNVNQASISWLQSVTRYPVFIIEEIVTIYLGYKIKNDFVVK